MVVALESLPSLNAQQLRELVQDLIAEMALQSQQHACVVATVTDRRNGATDVRRNGATNR
jgi:predicted metal-dependent hydrolase